MATPRAVSSSLRRSAQRLAAVPDEVVADAARLTIDEAIARGGRFGRGRLLAEVVQRRRAKGRSSVLLWGKPAGAWSIKSYGRRGGYTVRPRARRGRTGRRALRVPGSASGFAAYTRPGSTSGDGRWDDTVDAVAQAFPTVVDERVTGALGE